MYVVLLLSLFSRSASVSLNTFILKKKLFLAAKIKGHSPGSESGEFHGPAIRPNGAVTLFCCQPDAGARRFNTEDISPSGKMPNHDLNAGRMNFPVFTLSETDPLDLTLHQTLVLTVRRHPNQQRFRQTPLVRKSRHKRRVTAS